MWQDAEYEDRLVCFLDILGFKELVELSTTPPTAVPYIALGDDRPRDAKGLCNLFESIHSLLQMHKDEHYAPDSERFKEHSQLRPPIFPKGDTPDFQFNVFSDSIVFSANRLCIDTLLLFCSLVETITSLLFECSTTCRGGIAWGKLFHKDNILFGPAMVDAYHLEQKAVYPRVIVSSAVLNVLNSRDLDQLTKYWITEDDDGYHFIDIIKNYAGCPDYNYSVMCFTHGLHWLLSVHLEHPNLQVRDKYNWYRVRFNALLRKVKMHVKSGCPDRDYREEFLQLPYFK
ncbi:hypothetical protein LJB81_00220 [Desulfovibrio sp. OttesenSCG-928-M14]|nr:hypothetical protein [Desulfovibrio sp. OttesenSCG-928-M14]